MANKSAGHYAGHEKEPPQPHGPRVGGKQPPVHSHSKRNKRKIMPKSSGKRPF